MTRYRSFPLMKDMWSGARIVPTVSFWDLRRLIADKVAYDYVGGLREVIAINMA